MVLHTKQYCVEPEDCASLIAKLKRHKPLVSHDESGFPVHIYNLKRCAMIVTVQKLSEGETIKGFLEIGSGDLKNIGRLKSYLERKINSELEDIDMIKYSSLTQ